MTCMLQISKLSWSETYTDSVSYTAFQSLWLHFIFRRKAASDISLTPTNAQPLGTTLIPSITLMSLISSHCLQIQSPCRKLFVFGSLCRGHSLTILLAVSWTCITFKQHLQMLMHELLLTRFLLSKPHASISSNRKLEGNKKYLIQHRKVLRKRLQSFFNSLGTVCRTALGYVIFLRCMKAIFLITT